MPRFDDDGKRLAEFCDEFLVECPRCARGCKVILSEPGAHHSAQNLRLFQSRKAVCHQCGFNKNWDGEVVTSGDCVDWYFGFPLWLQSPCCSETLWALNERHLRWLEDYVHARERIEVPNINRSLSSRLPKWLKSSKNRDEVSKCLLRLRKRLSEFAG